MKLTKETFEEHTLPYMMAAGFAEMSGGQYNFHFEHEEDKWWAIKIDWDDDTPITCGWEHEFAGMDEYYAPTTVNELRDEITNILPTDTLLAMEMKRALQDILKRNRDEALRLANHPRLSGLAKEALEV